MSNDEGYEPAPIEKFHAEALDEFHKVKREVSGEVAGMVDGNGFNNLLAAFKVKIIETYGLSTTGDEYRKHGKFLPRPEEAPALSLDEAVEALKMPVVAADSEAINKAFSILTQHDIPSALRCARCGCPTAYRYVNHGNYWERHCVCSGDCSPMCDWDECAAKTENDALNNALLVTARILTKYRGGDVAKVLGEVKNSVWGYKHADGWCPDEDNCELCISLENVEGDIEKAIKKHSKGERCSDD